MTNHSSHEAIKTLQAHAIDPRKGLPDDIFYFITTLTPMVNVDLLIQDEDGRTLLSWRDDRYAGQGWHIPGGIVRFKETFEDRIRKVAQQEVGAMQLVYEPAPLEINEIIHPDRDVRGHFISILYRCFLPRTFQPLNAEREETDAGYLMWHAKPPERLLPLHEIYRKYLSSTLLA